MNTWMRAEECWCCRGRVIVLEDGRDTCPFCDGGGWLSDPPHSCRRSGRIFTNEWGHDPVDDPCDTCEYDPSNLTGLPYGQHHCPDCGCMVIAGEEHGPHDPDLRPKGDPRRPIGDWRLESL